MLQDVRGTHSYLSPTAAVCDIVGSRFQRKLSKLQEMCADSDKDNLPPEPGVCVCVCGVMAFFVC